MSGLGFRARADALQRFETRRGAWALGTLAADGSTTDLLDLAGAGVTVYAVAGAGAVDLSAPRRLVLRFDGVYRSPVAADLLLRLIPGAVVVVRYTGAVRTLDLVAVVEPQAADVEDTDREVWTFRADDPAWRAADMLIRCWPRAKR